MSVMPNSLTRAEDLIMDNSLFHIANRTNMYICCNKHIKIFLNPVAKKTEKSDPIVKH
jgi:hypothetical protein